MGREKWAKEDLMERTWKWLSTKKEEDLPLFIGQVSEKKANCVSKCTLSKLGVKTAFPQLLDPSLQQRTIQTEKGF